MRLAIVGLGRMGRAHLRAAKEQAVAVVEPLARVRDELEACGLRAYPSVEALLAAGGVDAAIVAAPTTLHRAVVEPLLDAGLPVLCEKPCCIDVEDTRALASLAERRGVVLQVGYWRRFVPELLRLHDDIHSGRLGSLSLVICQQWDKRPPPASFRRQSGGITIDMGVHEFDQLRWLTGQEIGRLAGAASTVGVDPPVPGDPESVELLATLSGGTVALVSLGRRFPPGDMCRVEVIGTQGFADRPFLWPPAGDQVFLEALRAQLHAFATAAAGGERRGASAADAAEALLAARRAAEALPAEGSTRPRRQS
jgi:myo-inositol 2-dehydrogenase/D-chiro-inositol 1-dehydrogenase